MKIIPIECAVVFASLLSGCNGGATGQTNNAVDHSNAAVQGTPEAQPSRTALLASATSASQPLAGSTHSASRTFSRDDDADGIDDYRVAITETFDGAGNLLSRTKDQDFDADGIVDSHFTTTFNAP
jgi:hypothetical protein